jgi:hypothetical protein
MLIFILILVILVTGIIFSAKPSSPWGWKTGRILLVTVPFPIGVFITLFIKELGEMSLVRLILESGYFTFLGHIYSNSYTALCELVWRIIHKQKPEKISIHSLKHQGISNLLILTTLGPIGLFLCFLCFIAIILGIDKLS